MTPPWQWDGAVGVGGRTDGCIGVVMTVVAIFKWRIMNFNWLILIFWIKYIYLWRCVGQKKREKVINLLWLVVRLDITTRTMVGSYELWPFEETQVYSVQKNHSDRWRGTRLDHAYKPKWPSCFDGLVYCIVNFCYSAIIYIFLLIWSILCIYPCIQSLRELDKQLMK